MRITEIKSNEDYMNQDAVSRSVLVLMVIAISALFFSMIHQFLMAIFLVGLFSALARPVYRRLKVTFDGKTGGDVCMLLYNREKVETMR